MAGIGSRRMSGRLLLIEAAVVISHLHFHRGRCYMMAHTRRRPDGQGGHEQNQKQNDVFTHDPTLSEACYPCKKPVDPMSDRLPHLTD